MALGQIREEIAAGATKVAETVRRGGVKRKRVEGEEEEGELPARFRATRSSGRPGGAGEGEEIPNNLE